MNNLIKIFDVAGPTGLIDDLWGTLNVPVIILIAAILTVGLVIGPAIVIPIAINKETKRAKSKKTDK